MPVNQRSNGWNAEGLLIDDTNRRLLSELQENARLSLAELGRRVGLSPPAVAERVQRLEQQGVILGYRAQIDPRALGFSRSAVVRIRPAPGQLRKVARARSGHPRGGRLPSRHRRRLLPDDGPPPRRGAPRGGDRPLRRARSDHHVDRSVGSGAAGLALADGAARDDHVGPSRSHSRPATYPFIRARGEPWRLLSVLLRRGRLLLLRTWRRCASSRWCSRCCCLGVPHPARAGQFNILRAAYPTETVPLPRGVGAYFAGYGFNAVIPARGGDVVRLFLTKTSVPRSSYPAVAPPSWWSWLRLAMGALILTFAFTQGVFPSRRISRA